MQYCLWRNRVFLQGFRGIWSQNIHHNWPESHIMGPVCWKKCPSEIYRWVTWPNVFFWRFFSTSLITFYKVIENAFARDLGGNTKLCTGNRLRAHDRSRSHVLGYSDTQLAHSTTEREGIISTLATIACVVAAPLQLLEEKRIWGWLLRGAILNRTQGAHNHLHISRFLLTIFGPIYYGPP